METKHLPDGTAKPRAGVVQVSGRIQMLLDGRISIDDLDDEELARGRPRSSDGTFKGVAPKVIPTALHNRMRKELFERAETKLRTGLVDSAKFMIDVVGNDKIDVKTRLDAAKWVFERVMGKNPDRVQLSADAPFMELFEELSRGPRKVHVEAEVVDAEVVDDRF